MNYPAAATPMARVFLLGNESVYPGWYLQHYVARELTNSRLDIDPEVDAFAAATEAAALLGCQRSQIQIEGAPWPNLPFPV